MSEVFDSCKGFCEHIGGHLCCREIGQFDVIVFNVLLKEEESGIYVFGSSSGVGVASQADSRLII